jgi:5,10-methylenetetrahydromethanopterin reductase
VGRGAHIHHPRPGIYPDVTHAVDWEAAIRGSEQYVDDEIADICARNFTLAGTARDVIERIEQAAELGVRNFYIQGPLSYVLPENQLAGFRDEVLPRIRSRHTRAS